MARAGRAGALSEIPRRPAAGVAQRSRSARLSPGARARSAGSARAGRRRRLPVRGSHGVGGQAWPQGRYRCGDGRGRQRGRAHLSLQDQTSIGGVLRDLNTQASIARNHAFYPPMLTLGAGDDQPGVKLLAAWYERNLAICARLLQQVAPGDRIVAFYGQGHIYLLQQCLREQTRHRARRSAELPGGNLMALRPTWRLPIASALLYTLAYNLTFFIQELFLVVPKALTPGLRPTLFHNNHTWQGDHPLASLFQGTGALAISHQRHRLPADPARRPHPLDHAPVVSDLDGVPRFLPGTAAGGHGSVHRGQRRRHGDGLFPPACESRKASPHSRRWQ